MTHEAHVQLFIAILSAHKGLAQAISVADMAARLNVSPRQAQQIKKLAVEEHGIPVGSSCGSTHGWFYCETQEELNATCAQYENRIRSLAQLVRRTKGAAGFQQFVGELALEFTEG